MNKAILDELEIGQEWYQPLQLVFAKYDINTPRRQACFIGQCQVESDNFKVLEENLNYSAERLMQIFPSRFPTLQIAELYAENPVKLAGKIYGSRADLGNENDGDGYKYRGRGIIQITGKLNYNFCGKALGVDLITNPALLLDPENAVMSAGWFWNKRGINLFADTLNHAVITKRINGGLNGFQERVQYSNRALEIIGGS